MTDGQTQPSVDELLDRYIAAWHAGEAPSSLAFVEQAAPPEQDELAELIAAFLQLAPTVEPTEARAAELAADPLVARLAGLEGAWWAARDAAGAGVGATAAAAEALAAAGDAFVEAGATWGETLRGLRERAGLSIGALADGFAARFGLTGDEAGRTPDALTALEAGKLPSTGVAARAARALEELLEAPRGLLVAGAAPAFGSPLLRGAMPEGDDERDRFTELLREVDDALAAEDAAPADYDETVRDLLGG